MSNQFNFKYTALSQEERKEIDSIRSRYAPKPQREDKLERLRRLDGIVKSVPTVWALVLGVLGTLIFGLGLTMILEWSIYVWGILLMVIGSVSITFAYPVYKKLLTKYKERHGEEIIRLSDELLNESEK